MVGRATEKKTRSQGQGQRGSCRKGRLLGAGSSENVKFCLGVDGPHSTQRGLGRPLFIHSKHHPPNSKHVIYQTPRPSFFIPTKKKRKKEVPFLHFMLFICSEKCAFLCPWEVLFICINKCSSLRPKNKKQMSLTRRRRLCFNFFGAL